MSTIAPTTVATSQSAPTIQPPAKAPVSAPVSGVAPRSPNLPPTGHSTEQQQRISIKDHVAKIFKASEKTEAPSYQNAPAQVTQTPVTTEAPADAATVPAKRTSLFKQETTTATAAPETATPVEQAPQPEDHFVLPENASSSAKENFTKLREVTKSLRAEAAAKAKEVEDVRKQLDTFKTASPADVAELNRLKEEHRVMSDKLAVLDIQNHPDFARQYTLPKAQALKEAGEVLSYNGRSDAGFESLLGKPLKDFNAGVAELTHDLNSMDAATVQQSMRTAYKLAQGEREALAQSKDLSNGLAAKAAAKAKQAFTETWENLGDARTFLQPLGLEPGASPLLIEATTKYNQALADVRINAERNTFGRMDERGVAQVASKAAVLDFVMQHGVPRMEAEYRGLVAQNRAMAEEIRALKGAKAPSGSSAGDISKSGASDAPKDLKSLVSSIYKR
jgi:hypothetical protein